MPTDLTKLTHLRGLIESAEISIKAAGRIIAELTLDNPHAKSANQDLIKNLSANPFLATEGEQNIIEGVFDGQNMMGPDQKIYPVPANYASKSKLIPGDILKLTIKPDGAFLYKQIGPIERKHVTGQLIYDDGQYKVVTDEKGYNVLLASITYFKANVGDTIALIVPAQADSDWGAIEHVIP
ncbi:MAG: 50S ribosomal protein L7/L12 [Candidatus Peregrinibacteria bacterium GW2011_GWE2_39_6]|nr:MAG: 50S ribosomal protein L7/L12 [Candidatus Peregrinibacteria bacterium GW2011_GWF2_39_17]KKR24498.1 MAG: 50S ribosomal protein L7/L12 [Candidatus Peregrinibacteria bacterium GW2011_GWE2_39_6]HCW32801.1 hypothetical protein [Candidatus Peregrinibacteria bacterium]